MRESYATLMLMDSLQQKAASLLSRMESNSSQRMRSNSSQRRGRCLIQHCGWRGFLCDEAIVPHESDFWKDLF